MFYDYHKLWITTIFYQNGFFKKMTQSSIEFHFRKNKKKSRNFKTGVILKILNDFQIQKIPSPLTRPRDNTATPALKPYP